MRTTPLLLAGIAACSMLLAQAPKKAENHDMGFKDTPMLPGLPYHVHDPDRPHPKVVAPAGRPGGAPSDAIVLFDGKDLSKWQDHGKRGELSDAKWTVSDGYFSVVKGTGDLVTREKFGDMQLHVEWCEPADIKGTSQGRGNSGIIVMSKYEIQVLESNQSATYADGQAGAIYGQWPPLVNATRKPGEWQAYDIVFTAPKFDGEKLVEPAYFTVMLNGVLLHNHKATMGPMVYRQVAHYTAKEAETAAPLLLQNHNGDPVRYRNIWVRRLGTYDQPE